jgi:hypothetical protein
MSSHGQESLDLLLPFFSYTSSYVYLTRNNLFQTPTQPVKSSISDLNSAGSIDSSQKQHHKIGHDFLKLNSILKSHRKPMNGACSQKIKGKKISCHPEHTSGTQYAMMTFFDGLMYEILSGVFKCVAVCLLQILMRYGVSGWCVCVLWCVYS